MAFWAGLNLAAWQSLKRYGVQAILHGFCRLPCSAKVRISSQGIMHSKIMLPLIVRDQAVDSRWLRLNGQC